MYIYTYIQLNTHTRDTILFSHRKEWNFANWSYVDGSGGHYTRWNMSDKEKYNVSHAAKSLQSVLLCATPWQPTRLPRPWDSPGKNTGMDCHFLLQCMKVKSLSRIQLLATPWTAAHQGPPSMGFSRQEYWSGVALPSLNVSHMWI